MFDFRSLCYLLGRGRTGAARPWADFEVNDDKLLYRADPPMTAAREIRGFMTVGCLNHFAEVFSEILDALMQSRLYDKSLSLDLAVLGHKGDIDVVRAMVAPFDRIRIAHTSADLTEYEYPALLLLEDVCRRSDGFVYYLHTKGASHDRTNQYHRHWRTLMLHHVVERHEECIASLSDHDAAGTVWKGDHYSGNFWWARAEHVRELPDLASLRASPRRVSWDPASDVRLQCEYWIGMRAGRYMTAGPMGVHLYDEVRWTCSASQIVRTLLEATAGRRCLELTTPGCGIGELAAPIHHVVSRDDRATFEMDEVDFAASGLGEASYDVIFVDSVHEADRCLAAMEWALGRLAPRGAIVVHDTSPPSAWHARPATEYRFGTDWNGDVWKAVVRFRQRHPDMYIATVDTDWGCTVVQPWLPAQARLDPLDGQELNWKQFEKNRSSWLNLVPVRRLRQDLFHLPRVLGRVAIASRTDVMNVLISRFGLDRYLEIGLGDPADNFERIISSVRQSVDPNAPATFRMTSDDFFERAVGCHQYDLVFVDGLHEEDQCLRDLENALRRLSPRGFIVVHDTSPPTEWNQRPVEQYTPGEVWNGTAWKAVVRFRRAHPGLALYTVDVDWGCTVIRGASSGVAAGVFEAPEKLDWARFEANRKDWLNLTTVEDFCALVRGATAW